VRFLAQRKQLDDTIGAMIAKALADPALEQRTDVLASLLLARYDDGTPVSHSDITDELFTLLVAGHETTATSLAWTIERLRRHPDVLARLVDEIDAGQSSRLLQATIYEVLRTRPVIAATARQVIAPSISMGQWVIPRGYTVSVNIYLAHLNEEVYKDAAAFNPDRFLDVPTDVYSWVPFGGGSRRCPGAAFAHMEMEVVLRAILREFELVPTTAPGERWQNKGVSFGPSEGARVVVRRRRNGAAATGPEGHTKRGAPW
jgi:cytochrome P450